MPIQSTLKGNNNVIWDGPVKIKNITVGNDDVEMQRSAMKTFRESGIDYFENQKQKEEIFEKYGVEISKETIVRTVLFPLNIADVYIVGKDVDSQSKIGTCIDFPTHSTEKKCIDTIHAPVKSDLFDKTNKLFFTEYDGVELWIDHFHTTVTGTQYMDMYIVYDGDYPSEKIIKDVDTLKTRFPIEV